ncbi:hypothetical protein OH76DRAFT_1084230 [Lentinus brumalis]|uniref:Uncharacterized protein n=1 Tax=Lentinus brumalis TaxID=2498619 RepID=A0A371DPB9_9APHY|nr:hypothetical protein OH76DRAFT_1084230 [Polyporus brumalis]
MVRGTRVSLWTGGGTRALVDSGCGAEGAKRGMRGTGCVAGRCPTPLEAPAFGWPARAPALSTASSRRRESCARQWEMGSGGE